jgi:hypothetical protein
LAIGDHKIRKSGVWDTPRVQDRDAGSSDSASTADFVLMLVMLVHVLPSAEPMADSASSQSQVTQDFSWFIEVLLRGIVDPLLCRTRMNRSSALTVMRFCFRNEVVLGAKRAVAEQTPAHNLALVCKDWLFLAEGHQNRRRFGAMLGWIAMLSLPAG